MNITFIHEPTALAGTDQGLSVSTGNCLTSQVGHGTSPHPFPLITACVTDRKLYLATSDTERMEGRGERVTFKGQNLGQAYYSKDSKLSEYIKTRPPPPRKFAFNVKKKTFEIYPVSKIYQTNLQIFENLLNSFWDEEKIRQQM